MAHEDPPVPGGSLERALLVALWEGGGGERSARDLHQVVGAERGIAYTTVTKVLDRMANKRLVKRRREGRTYLHKAAVEQTSTQRSVVAAALRSIVGTDPRPAVAALVGALEDVSPELLDELAAELAARGEGEENGA